MRIPRILVRTVERGSCATFALRLSALEYESPEWFDGSSPAQRTWALAHARNVRFLHLLCGWDHSFCLELHLVSHPSLDLSVQSRNDLAIVFHVERPTAVSATEVAVADSLRVGAALESFWPTAEFTILDPTESVPFAGFEPQSAVLVCHREELIGATRTLCPERQPIGFQAQQLRAYKPVGAGTGLAFQHVYPWVPPCSEDMSILLDALLRLPTPRAVVFRITNDLAGRERQGIARLTNNVDSCERYLAGSEQGQLPLTAQVQAIRSVSLKRLAQLSEGALRGSVFVFAPGGPDYATATVVGQTITGDYCRRLVETPFEGGFCLREVDPHAASEPFACLDEEPFTIEEASSVLRLPLPVDSTDSGLPFTRHRTLPLRITRQTSAPGDLKFGINHHRGSPRAIAVPWPDRLRHTLLMGATGTGKSTMLLSAMLQDAREGHGLAVIDPPGELADEFLARFPRERVDDLIIVDFNDREFPVPLNFLSWRSIEDRDLLIDTLYSTLLAIYRNPDFFGPIFESHFRSALRLLLGEQPRRHFTPTLLELPQVFRNTEFRKYLQHECGDEDVKAAILEAERVTYGEQKLENIAPYVNAKFARFLQDSQLRRIIGHGDMALDFRRIIDEGKIAVFKLAQGRVGKHVSDMLIAQLVARFRIAAMSRADVPAVARRPFSLYCDEFQVIADENFSQMLSQCRKYGLALVLANQYATQLRDRGVLEAVLGNVGTVACYRLGPDDAKLLAPVFAPEIGARDLLDCPNFEGYMKLCSGPSSLRAFSFRNDPDRTAPDPRWAHWLCSLSRERWGVRAQDIDARIANRNEFIRGLPATARARAATDDLPPAVRPAEHVAFMTQLDAVVARFEREKPQWKEHRDQVDKSLDVDPQGALTSALFFFLPIDLQWFFAILKVLTDRGRLRACDLEAFVAAAVDDQRLSTKAREQLILAGQAFART
jgi:hypothetical protein